MVSLLEANEAQLYDAFVLFALALCPILLVTLPWLFAPYGRHKSKSWLSLGPRIPTRWFWVIMLAPSSLVFAVIYFCGADAFRIAPLVLFLLWQSHYFHRSFIYPFRIRTSPGDTTPLILALSVGLFNFGNSYINAAPLSWETIGQRYELTWLADPRFIVGVILFAVGYRINRKADSMLIALRKPGEGGYKIPRGWLYERLSCPNYFGEFLIWMGWAIATWSRGGAVFMLCTLANLVPRALQNHRWYHETFPGYPANRKAVIPHFL